MLKQILTLILSLAILFITSNSLQAQQMQGPTKAPAADINVSDAELEKFIDALNTVNKIQESYQQEMAEMVTESGLSIERFNEIANAQQNPSQEVTANETEMKKFNDAVEEISSSREAIQSEFQEAITDAGMEVTRYQQIMTKANQDQELQMRIQSMMQ